jgi:hypothetical protein
VCTCACVYTCVHMLSSTVIEAAYSYCALITSPTLLQHIPVESSHFVVASTISLSSHEKSVGCKKVRNASKVTVSKVQAHVDSQLQGLCLGGDFWSCLFCKLRSCDVHFPEWFSSCITVQHRNPSYYTHSF